MLWDRLCVRRKGDKMSGETAHRDVAKFKLPDDEIFGGWLNLDSWPDHIYSGLSILSMAPNRREDAASQHFRCLPGSHSVLTEGSGSDPKQMPGREISVVACCTGRVNADGLDEMIENATHSLFRAHPGFLKEKTSKPMRCIDPGMHRSQQLRAKEVPSGHLLIFYQNILHEAGLRLCQKELK